MRTAIIFILVLGLCLVKRDNHSCFISTQNIVRNGLAPRFPLKNITGSTNKRSPVDLIASAACCDDDDDDFGPVKKKTGSAVSFLLNDVFEKIFVHSELKRAQQFSKHSDQSSKPVYIFQRELLI